MENSHCLRLSVWTTLVSAFFIVASCNGKESIPTPKESSERDAPCVTVGTEKVSAVSAVLMGKANPTDPYDMKLGFQFKKAGGQLVDPSDVFATRYDPEKYTYSVSITGLEPGVEYSFRSFIIQNKQEQQFGEMMLFTTKALSSMLGTLEACDVTTGGAILKGRLNLTDVEYKNVDYGFYWGTSEVLHGTSIKGGIIAENVYSANLTTLSSGTQYWYKTFVKVDNQTFYGDIKTFTTAGIPVAEVTLDKTEYVFHTIGASLTLTPTISPSDASDQSVSWRSSDESVATVDQAGEVTAVGNGTAVITVTTTDQSKTATCAITVVQWVTDITLNKISLALAEGRSETLMATVVPDNAQDKSMAWTSSDESVAIVDQNGKVTAVSKGTATIKAAVKDGSGKFTSCTVRVYKIEVPDAVNLGLSVKWASFNLGASMAEEYGLYYAWGETEPKSEYMWSTYKWCDGEYSSLTKYNVNNSYGAVDNKTILDEDDDVAHVKLGGSWRMPTDAEWTELRDNCIWEWTALNGIKGCKVTSKKLGYTDQWIFLPAAGLMAYDTFDALGAVGIYWSSSITTNSPCCAHTVTSYFEDFCKNERNRDEGLPVRPVSE